MPADTVDEPDINRLIFEAQVAAVPAGIPPMPWERGTLRHIFDDQQALLPPRWFQPRSVLVSGMPALHEQAEVVGTKRTVPASSSLFGSCIVASSTAAGAVLAGALRSAAAGSAVEVPQAALASPAVEVAGAGAAGCFAGSAAAGLAGAWATGSGALRGSGVVGTAAAL